MLRLFKFGVGDEIVRVGVAIALSTPEMSTMQNRIGTIRNFLESIILLHFVEI
jgi:hypothetical protein